MSSPPQPGGDVATIAATRVFYERLAAAFDADTGQIEVALGNLAEMELDQQTLDNFQSAQEDAQRAATRCRGTVQVLDAIHRPMEDAVNATPDAAKTEFYQDGPAQPSRHNQPGPAGQPEESPMPAAQRAGGERADDADRPDGRADQPAPQQHHRCDECGYVVGPRAGLGRCPNCQTRGGTFTPTEIARPAYPSDEALARDTRDVEAQIRRTYAELADRPGFSVPLADLRDALPADLDRDTVDAALTKLAGHSDVHVLPRTDQQQADPRTQQAALHIGGSYDHTISIETDRPGMADTLQRIRSTSQVQAESMLAPLTDAEVSYLAERMDVDTGGSPAEVRQRIAEQAEANRQAWLADARQGEHDGKLLGRADNDPEWVKSWTEDDRQAAREAAARLLERADREPSWAYIRDRATRWS